MFYARYADADPLRQRCQNAEMECYPFRNPQPVKLAEKRSDALRTPDGEYESSSGVEKYID